MPEETPQLHEDSALLRAFRQGEPQALEAVYFAHVDAVARIVRAGLHRWAPEDRQEWPDLVQDTFVRAFQERPRLQYDGQRPYAAYLATIAKNLVIDRVRRRRPEQPTEREALERELSIALEEAPPWAEPETVRVVETYLAQLAAPLSEVHRYRYELDYSQAETAKALGLTRQNVRTLENKLRTGLKRELQRQTHAQGRKRSWFLSRASGMLLILFSLTQCSLESSIRSGKLGCAGDTRCPTGYRCEADWCVALSQAQTSNADAGPSDASTSDPEKDAGPERPAPAPKQACDAERPCEASTDRCENGVCRAHCRNEGECPAGQRCLTGPEVCIDDPLQTCGASDCKETQSCVEGLCSAEIENDVECSPFALCGENGVCYADVCRTFPRCPQDGRCPVGPAGALCSNFVYPELTPPVCLPVFCLGAEHCPGDARCIQKGGVGFCSRGQSGEACASDEDCLSNTCIGFLGACA